jgi:hypothetical protein
MTQIQSYNPFLVFSNQLEALLEKAKLDDNPALFLYQNGGRNIIFMLEGLTRLHEKAFESKKMEVWYERFKTLEDMIGQIDYLDIFRKKFEKENTLDAKELAGLSKKADKAIEELNKTLKKKGWLDQKMLKFDQFILKCKFKYDEKYQAQIVKTYKKEIQKIIEFANKIHFNITEVETELHEMRRKLRWLSIYSQALSGYFVLDKMKSNPTWSKQYMTEEIIQSPFIALPKKVADLPVIYLDYHCFVALSYVISTFGKLKDNGLQNIVLEHDLHFSKNKVMTILGDKYVSEVTILAQGSMLLKTFFGHKILENLVKKEIKKEVKKESLPKVKKTKDS